jgi:protein FRA10AC1
MSWKTAGKLVSGPPTASGSGSSVKYRQNTGGLNAFQREQQFAAHYSRKDREIDDGEFGKDGKTDWDVLKENHRFIRDDEDVGDVSWEERLARAYESKLFKEFALVSIFPFHEISILSFLHSRIPTNWRDDCTGKIRHRNEIWRRKTVF